MNFENLKQIDYDIYNLNMRELHREQNTINLIASENYASEAVLEANSTYFVNKYGEGYPSKRYYSGCENIDEVENICIDRAKELFNTDYHANVQVMSGSMGNMAIYKAFLNYGDTILGMRLSEGGHLTHSATVNFSGQLYKSIQYGLDENGLINYNEVEELAVQHKPKMIVCGSSAYSRLVDFKKFKEIADKVGAYLLADISHFAGLVATGLHPTPFGYADAVMFTTHKNLRSNRGAIIMCKQEYAKAIDKAIFPELNGGHNFSNMAGKAVGLKEALQPSFKLYQEQVLKNAKAMCDRFIELDYKIVSNTTENHMFLIDLRNKGLTGKQAQILLEEVGITVNKNTVPNETESPFVTSGIRIGSNCITTRGMKKEECVELVDIIDDVLNQRISNKLAKEMIRYMCKNFPIYQ